MIEEAMVAWLNALLTTTVYYEFIPQSVTARPVVVVSAPQSFDEGNTAVVTVSQKLSRFVITIHANTMTDISSPREVIRTALNAIAATPGQVQIGQFRCQSIKIEDIREGLAQYTNDVNDRRQPGADQQKYAFCDIFCFASYHRNPV